MEVLLDMTNRSVQNNVSHYVNAYFFNAYF